MPSITVEGRCHALSHIFGYVNHDTTAALPGLNLRFLPPRLWWLLEGLQCQLMVLLEERLREEGLLLPSTVRASLSLEVAEVRGSQRVQICPLLCRTCIFRVILRRRDGVQDGHRVWQGEVAGRLRLEIVPLLGKLLHFAHRWYKDVSLEAKWLDRKHGLVVELLRGGRR